MFYKSLYKSPVGLLTLISDGIYLTHIIFEKEPYYQNIKNVAIFNDNLDIFKQVKKWLDKYFHNEKSSIDKLKISLKGTLFQIKVWNELKGIPYGRVVTYHDIAKKINSNSCQAVGHAIGLNPLPIIIPCHRVVGTGKKLIGYSGGIENKIKLLKLENIDITKYKYPKGGKHAKV